MFHKPIFILVTGRIEKFRTVEYATLRGVGAKGLPSRGVGTFDQLQIGVSAQGLSSAHDEDVFTGLAVGQFRRLREYEGVESRLARLSQHLQYEIIVDEHHVLRLREDFVSASVFLRDS